MDSDTPTPQNLSPQDPARFSKPKSEPPILDLEAEKSSQGKKAETSAGSGAPKHDTLRVEKKPASRGMLSGFIGGIIGGGIIALGVLTYDRVTQTFGDEIAALSQALGQKVERDELVNFQSRLSAIETALDNAKAELSAAVKTSAPPDPQIAKRIAALEESIRTVNKSSYPTASLPDQRGVKLALLIAIRDGLRNDASVQGEINALEKIGETSPAFQDLKSALGAPLVPYEELHADVLKRIKTLSLPREASPNKPETSSRFSSFLSQFITVRPASTISPKLSSTDLSFTPLLDALDEDDAGAALNAIAALPQDERDMFTSVAAELKRRADVERSIMVMMTDMLDMIAKGDTP